MKRLLPICAIAWVAVIGTIKADTPSLVIDSGGNTRYVKNVIFTKDGTSLVSVGDDKVIRVWDIRLRKTVRTIRGPVGVCSDCRISAMALSPDNNYLVVGGTFPGNLQMRYAIHVYRFESGIPLPPLTGHRDSVRSLAFSPDGRYLASGGDHNDHSILLWEVGPQGFRLADTVPNHGSTIACLSFSPDSQKLASGGTDVSVGLWDLADSSAVRGRILEKRHDEQVYGVGFSPDARFLVTGGQDNKLNLWDANGSFIRQIALLESGVTSLAFSPDPQNLQVIVGTERGVSTIFSIPEGGVVGTPFKGDDDQVFDLAFSPDGKLTAVAGGFNGEISMLTYGKLVAVLRGNGRTAWSVGFARDGNSIAFGNLRQSLVPNQYGSLQQIIRLKPLSGNQPTVQTVADMYEISLGADVKDQSAYQTAIVEAGGFTIRTNVGQTIQRRFGEKIINTVRREDPSLQILRGGTRLRSIDLNSEEGRTHKGYTLSRDGLFVVTGGERGYLALYETETGKLLRRFYGHTNDVWAVALSPDNRFLVSASSDQTVKLWDIRSGQYLLSFFIAADSEWVSWTPHGYYVSSSGGDRYFGWQMQSADNEQPKFLDAAQFQRVFNRPDVVAKYLEIRDINEALNEADKKLPSQRFVKRIESLASKVFDQTAVLKEVMPPEVLILQPKDGLVVSQPMLPVQIVVSSRGLPITVVNVFLNGIRKGTFKGNPGITGKSQDVKINTTIALESPENVLTVIAATEAATSKPQTRRVKYVATPGLTVPPLVRPTSSVAGHGSSEKADGARFEKVLYRPDYAPGRSFSNDASATPARKKSEAPRISSKTGSLAPEPINLSIVEPHDGFEARDNNIKVKVVAFSNRPAQVRVFINDAQLVPNSDIDPTGEASDYQVPLSGQEGERVLKVVVSNDQTEATKTRRIVFRPRLRSKPNLIFLGIGISNYESDRLALQFADADARDLAKAFCLQGGPDRMFSKVEAEIITNAEAHRTNINRALQRMNDAAEAENDIRVLVLAGHGDLINNQYYFYGHGATLGQNGKLVEAENHSVSWSSIATKLGEKPGITLVFVDTCRSGAPDMRPLLISDLSTEMMIYASSEKDQLSNEIECMMVGTENKCFNHGAFTVALLEALSGKADKGSEDDPKDGRLSPEELSEYLRSRVKTLTDNRQVPKYKPPLQGIPDNFFISLTQPPLPAQPAANCPKEGVPQ